ncbi:MAG: hypothetical protein QOD93_3696, partial [Acetobacteraceae bacterium]|nr:hypothetical protein [Acetobacteraceae bacterium]
MCGDNTRTRRDDNRHIGQHPRRNSLQDSSTRVA